MNAKIIDLFAGPGGWDEGLRMLGREDVVGVEWDKWACTTAQSNGHARVQEDISKLSPEDFASRWVDRPLEGLIASPPCQAWSLAGKRGGEHDRQACHELADRMDILGNDSIDFTEWVDPRSHLVAQPVRWARDLNPEWIALEEVPAVIGLWEHFADIFRSWGYSAETGVLSAEAYGVPQTRKRAILIASRVGEVVLPEPSHSRYYPRDRERLDPGVEKWVSMAEELPEAHITPGSWLRSSAQPNAAIRYAYEPCFAFAFGNDSASVIWGSPEDDPMVGGRMLASERPLGSRRITPTEAGALQTFPKDYRWKGGTGKIFEQIGNAVPPRMASCVIRAAMLG